MLPKRHAHDHERIQRLKPLQMVDLRDYGLAGAAPSEDGHKMLVFRLADDGSLYPVT